jgi:hypothetical protein
LEDGEDAVDDVEDAQVLDALVEDARDDGEDLESVR